MSTKLFILCGLVLTTIITVKGAPSSNLPKGFIQCKKSDPKFNECLKDGFQSAIPRLTNDNYEVNGNVLVGPVKGKGKCKLAIDISNAVFNVQFKPVVKNGNTFLDTKNLTLKFVATNLHMQFDRLFNGDKALGDNMNVFLNENWRDILNELQPAIEEVLGMVFKDISQQFVKRIPENEKFLP
ncbi:Haemolymph juvenile hormone binding [Cinara cedri]|uniref:Haemolymph juvenile hormone binding n=1 Tax=Cinara cedri TaxID=506608 RepID=A0A5E4N9Q7_9HEMI|nr:Haemolymph juvenile hormone binding [Cinara cedri]